MEGNLQIVYFGTLVSHRYEYSLLIEGENGSLWTDRKRVWWRKKGWRFFLPVKLVAVPKGDELPYPRAGTTSLLNQVRDAVLQNKEAETSGRDNFWTLAMVAAAARSAEQARNVSISEVVNFHRSRKRRSCFTTVLTAASNPAEPRTENDGSAVTSVRRTGRDPRRW